MPNAYRERYALAKRDLVKLLSIEHDPLRTPQDQAENLLVEFANLQDLVVEIERQGVTLERVSVLESWIASLTTEMNQPMETRYRVN